MTAQRICDECGEEATYSSWPATGRAMKNGMDEDQRVDLCDEHRPPGCSIVFAQPNNCEKAYNLTPPDIRPGPTEDTAKRALDLLREVAAMSPWYECDYLGTTCIFCGSTAPPNHEAACVVPRVARLIAERVPDDPKEIDALLREAGLDPVKIEAEAIALIIEARSKNL